MYTLLEHFITEQVELHREVVKRYCEFMGIPLLHSTDNMREYPREVIVAQAYIDAYSKVANFLNYDAPEVHEDMTSAMAFKTAFELFSQDISKQPFNWDVLGADEKRATSLVDKNWDQQDAVKGFPSLLYFWYYYQRAKKPEPEVA